jgi:hypothetical protein
MGAMKSYFKLKEGDPSNNKKWSQYKENLKQQQSELAELQKHKKEIGEGKIPGNINTQGPQYQSHAQTSNSMMVDEDTVNIDLQETFKNKLKFKNKRKKLKEVQPKIGQPSQGISKTFITNNEEDIIDPQLKEFFGKNKKVPPKNDSIDKMDKNFGFDRSKDPHVITINGKANYNNLPKQKGKTPNSSITKMDTFFQNQKNKDIKEAIPKIPTPSSPNQKSHLTFQKDDVNIAGLKETKKKKPSSGLSKKQRSSVVKKARAGKDIGSKGKNFDKVAKAAGGGEKGKKIAASIMWKDIKR